MPDSRARGLALGGLLFITTFGCAVLRSIAGTNTVDLEGADVRSMGVDIRKQDKTICPRERVQMAVFADVVLKGETRVQKLETWQGPPGANRNGKLSFDDFAFHSEQGSFDADGWFAPKRDLLATVDKEMSLRTVFRKRPDKFSFTTSYKPDYRCIHDAGRAGTSGGAGQTGASGAQGMAGTSGSATSAGRAGSDGAPGGPGGNGGQGEPGPKLVAFATFVKTPFYERLIALRVEGSTSDFVLAHPEGKLTLLARGGDGGGGGDGGAGGSGGPGGSGNPAGAGGNGAQGGGGGNGGSGGPGGSIELVFDERFPELRTQVTLDVAGGSAGSAGRGGRGGAAGRGGSGSGTASYGADGSQGQPGADGASGNAGPNGSASARAGNVAEKFAGLTGITVL